MVMNCTQAIEYYKKEIMNLLGMKEWGVLPLALVDDETVSKVYDLMGKIDELKFAKYELDRMRSEIVNFDWENILKGVNNANR